MAGETTGGMSAYGAAAGYAGLATSIMGYVQQRMAASQQQKSIKKMLAAAQKEAAYQQQQGYELDQAAHQRAWAALQDLSFLASQNEAKERTINEQGQSLESTVAARAASSGVDMVGSPVLAQTYAALQTARQVENVKLTTALGERQFKFAAEQELIRGQQAIEAGKVQAQSTVDRANASAAAGSAQANSTFNAANRDLVKTLGSESTVKLVDTTFSSNNTTKPSALTPYTPSTEGASTRYNL